MGMSSGGGGRAIPYINVTPLIDVLLVLLIIFMVVTPLKPKRFLTQIPEPPPPNLAASSPSMDTMKVKIYGDHPSDPKDATKRNMVEFIHAKGDVLGGDLVGTFDENGQYNGGQALAAMVKDEFNNPKRPEDKRTVYIEAPTLFPYGKIVQVIDAIKAGGSLWCAEHGKSTADPDPTKAKPTDCPQVPVGLQVDALKPQ